MLRALLQIGIQLTSQRLILPFWHGVAPHTPAHVRHIYAFPSPESFRDTLDRLLKQYTPLEVSDLQAVAEQRHLSKPGMFLSFDDGLREIGEYALPILQEKGVPAAIFVNPAFVDNRRLFFRYQVSLAIEKLSHLPEALPALQDLQDLLEAGVGRGISLKQRLLSLGYHDQGTIDQVLTHLSIDTEEYLEQHQPYLLREELHGWQQKGFYIGAHSMDHPAYNALSFDQQLSQTLESVTWVEQYFPAETRLFSFPFTDYQVKRAFFEAIYQQNQVHLSFGTAGLKHDIDPRHFQRIPMEKGLGTGYQKIAGAYLKYLIKAPLRRNQMVRT